ncbi:MAG: hemerythrin domain-containing protein [Flavobacteriales bacterium]|nr:hemerythrin domain-containing protein [Flavobacteriales bacterium]
MPHVPIKRHECLQPLSRDHHHGLLLSWKIREGFKRNVEVERIKQYADWFFVHQLSPHFELEERSVFPILGNDHESVKRALAEHRRLRRLFVDMKDITRALHLIEEELEAHIRFEERVLFKEIEAMATLQMLTDVALMHADGEYNEVWEDEFWRMPR